MIDQVIELVCEIETRIQNDSRKTHVFQNTIEKTRNEYILEQIHDVTKQLEPSLKERVESEFLSWGPLDALLLDSSVSEIMINEFDQIWIEQKGQVTRYHDRFATKLSFQNFLYRLLSEVKKVLNVEHPVVEGVYKNFRVQIIGPELAAGSFKICIRRQALSPWTLDQLLEVDWCDAVGAKCLRDIIKDKKNFLVIGGTGTGKTSVLGALAQELPPNERVIYIEDTPELKLSNPVSLKLLTREKLNGSYPAYTQSDLIRSALRLRPDRLVMGEMRGPEAKDFLMALSTGHDGSFGSLHAQSPAQALLRLEMLIQLGAPFWGLSAIRRLIQISLHYIIVVGRQSSGHRALQSIYRVASLEENGFTLEACYRFSSRG